MMLAGVGAIVGFICHQAASDHDVVIASSAYAHLSFADRERRLGHDYQVCWSSASHQTKSENLLMYCTDTPSLFIRDGGAAGGFVP